MLEPRNPSHDELAGKAEDPFEGVIDLRAQPALPLDPDDDPTSYPGAQPDRALGTKPEDFPSFYVRHRATMTSVARRYMGDARDADEVVQEAFIKMFLALPELPSELAALAYARRTVVNLCIDRLRAAGRRPRLVDLDAVAESDLGLHEDDDALIAAEDSAVVRDALSRLTPLHREALLMREVEERPLPEIAAVLDIPEENVKHVLHRARKALRRLLVGTSVDPAVDLETASFAELLAAKPSRIAVILLFVLGGVFGGAFSQLGGDKGAGTGGTPLADAPGLGGSLSQLPATPTKPTVTSPVVPHASKPSTSSTPQNQASSPAADQSTTPTTGGTQSTGSTGGSASGSGGITLPMHPTTPTEASGGTSGGSGQTLFSGKASSPVELTGLGDVSDVRLGGQSRQVTDSGYTSSSSISARNSRGLFTLSQNLHLARLGSKMIVTGATLNPVVPNGTGAVGFVLSTNVVSVTEIANGYRVQIEGLANSLVGDANAPGVVVVLSAVYDKALTRVMSETLHLGIPDLSAGQGLAAPVVGVLAAPVAPVAGLVAPGVSTGPSLITTRS